MTIYLQLEIYVPFFLKLSHFLLLGTELKEKKFTNSQLSSHKEEMVGKILGCYSFKELAVNNLNYTGIHRLEDIQRVIYSNETLDSFLSKRALLRKLIKFASYSKSIILILSIPPLFLSPFSLFC